MAVVARIPNTPESTQMTPGIPESLSSLVGRMTEPDSQKPLLFRIAHIRENPYAKDLEALSGFAMATPLPKQPGS